MAKTLFIGNGINLLKSSGSWVNILKHLAGFVDKDEVILEMIDEKPFTLVFEEIFLRSARLNKISELDLKKEVAKIINDIPSSEYHEKIVGLNLGNIITTNYDYNLEIASGSNFTDTSIKNERKYSLYRKNTVLDKNIWHIHGEYSVPNSISLGHDHISGSLHHIRDYLVTRSERTKKKSSPFISKNIDFEKNGLDYTWLDIFLRDDILFYGFSLDYTEIDIWWLLSYKERLRIKKYPVGKSYFYYQEFSLSNKDKAKILLLDSFGVRTIPLLGISYQENFSRFIKNIDTELLT